MSAARAAVEAVLKLFKTRGASLRRYQLVLGEGGIARRFKGCVEEIRLADIVAIVAHKIDRLTYDEIFLELIGRNDERLVIGELDALATGSATFDDVCAALARNFSSIAPGWRGRLESEKVLPSRSVLCEQSIEQQGR
jgi:hypothetical protein